MIILRPSTGISPVFLSYAINLNKRKIIAKVTGITVRHINSKTLSGIEIKIPSAIEEQKAIASALSEIESIILVSAEKREKYVRIKEGMMRDLLTGRVRI